MRKMGLSVIKSSLCWYKRIALISSKLKTPACANFQRPADEKKNKKKYRAPWSMNQNPCKVSGIKTMGKIIKAICPSNESVGKEQ